MGCDAGGWIRKFIILAAIKAICSSNIDPTRSLETPSLRLGPACAPLAPYFSELAVVNGVFMSDINVSHDANLDYISTGESVGSAPDLPVEIAYASKAGPFGVVFNESLKRGTRNIFPTTVSNLQNFGSGVELTEFQDFLSQLNKDGLYRQAQAAYSRSISERTRLVRALGSLKEEIERSQALRRWANR